MAGNRSRMNWSIRNRIMVPYLALVVALVGGTGLATAHWAAAWARRHYVERGRGIAGTLQRSSFPLTEGVLWQLKGLGGAEFALVSGDGRVLSSTLGRHSGDGDDLPSPDFLRDHPHDADLSFDRTLSFGGVEYRVAVVDRTHVTGTPDPRRVLILLPEPTLRAVAWEARRAVLAFTVVGATLAAALASWIGRTLSRPLSSILTATRRIGRGDLEPQGLPRHRDDEIGELAEGVAQMTNWLRRLLEERVQTERLMLIRQLSAGLAHELRIPLTAARMTLQIFVERNGDRDTEALRIALAELARMERHVRRFLQVARPEPPRFEVVGIGPILESSALGLSASADHRGIKLEIGADGDLPRVRVDPDQIGQVITNLIGNALDAAGPGDRVRLAALASPTGGVTIDVEDDGPGVPQGEESRLFEPFFTTKPEGVGLGLPLSVALAREHGGTIEHDRRRGWTRFRVSLPGTDGATGLKDRIQDGRSPEVEADRAYPVDDR